MGILDKLFGVREPEAGERARASAGQGPSIPSGVAYRELFRRLGSADRRERRDTALLLSGLGHRAALSPLLRSYLAHGDPEVLGALATFGPRVTPIAARATADRSLGVGQRARLMDVLGATGDPAAAHRLTAAAADREPAVRVAACAALARLGDARGLEGLAHELMSTNAGRRALALDALGGLEGAEAEAVVEAHVRRWLSAGGAVPEGVAVSLPLLVSAGADLADLVCDQVRRSPRNLTIVTGPAASELAETCRPQIARALAGGALHFTTERHRPDEQLAVLTAARDEAAAGTRREVVIFGPLPSPRGTHPPPAFLLRREGRRCTARIVVVGPHELAGLMAWWEHVQATSEVTTDLAAVVTALIFGRSELTPEEQTIHRLAGDDRRDAFARAFLARL